MKNYDEAGAPQGEIVTERVYGADNRLKEVINDKGGASPLTANQTTRFEYDPNGNLYKEISPLAVSGAQTANAITYEYDERDLPFLTKREGELDVTVTPETIITRREIGTATGIGGAKADSIGIIRKM